MSAPTLAKVGARAVLMAFLPCLCEVGVVTLIAPLLLPVSTLEAAILGGVLAAVSPAVVVPLMIRFIEAGRGADKGAPTLVLAGASCDDAVAITLTTALVALLVGKGDSAIALQVTAVPVSIVSGIGVGLGLGLACGAFFAHFNPRATKRVLILLGLALLLHHLEGLAQGWFASLVAIMTVGFILLARHEPAAHEVSSKLGKIWLFAQILLFVFVGMEVNIGVALDAGLGGVAVIALGLGGRSIGVLLCLIRSTFTFGERLFVIVSYLPKATVQAAIGGMPLLALSGAGMATAPGELILAMAVMSIVLTAPLGAFLITFAGPRCLTPPSEREDPARWAALESR